MVQMHNNYLVVDVVVFFFGGGGSTCILIAYFNYFYAYLKIFSAFKSLLYDNVPTKYSPNCVTPA